MTPLAFLAAVLSVAQTDPVYQESGGVVVVEIESHAVAGGWARETALAGFTGSAYYTWRGPDLFSSPGSGVLRFRFTVSTAGTWHFRIHNRHDFADSTEENDCFTRMDGGAWVKTFSGTRGQWTWATNHEFDANTKPAAQYTLSAGTHTLEFSGRSRNFSIDRFHLYRDGTADPTDTSRPQSSTTPGAPGPGPASAAVSSLALIDADTDAPIAGFESLSSGAVLNLGTLPTRNLNLQAVTTPAAVGSVVFSYDGNAAFRTETGAPYALAGDSAGNYAAWTPAVGNHSAGATPYDAAGGTGAAGTALVVTFSVIDDPTTPSSNGTAAPAPGGAPASSNAGTKDGPSHCGSGSAGAADGLSWLVAAALLGLLFRTRS